MSGQTPDTVRLFGLDFANQSLGEAAERVTEMAISGVRLTVNFVNAHCANIAAGNGDYWQALKNSSLLFADGIGMRLAARAGGSIFRDNINGTDLFPLLCAQAARKKIAIGLLGARPGVAAKAAENMERRYPGLMVSYVQHGYFSPTDEGRIFAEIEEAGVGILFVALGVPAQELFAVRCRAVISVPVVLGVGALFDFYSGRMKRAPRIMRQCGLEWLFRLALEPSRLFKRYVVGNNIFLWRVLSRRLQGAEVLRHKPLPGI